MPLRLLATVLCVMTVLVGAARAQVVERNLPAATVSQPPAIRGAPELLTSSDQTPLGSNLRAVVLLGARDRVVNRSKAAGVDVSRADPAFAAAIGEQLAPFIGQPTSQKLISDVQLAIARVYRHASHPFVSVTVPPQEITGGVLQVRVFEFRIGAIKVAGTDAAEEAHIRGRFRLRPGDLIDTRILETDIDWLNRNPLARVEAVFGPGKDLAVTDLTLQVNRGRPIQLYGGYANSGTLLTDRDRFFLGANASFADVFASYQLSGSKDFWGKLGDSSQAKYLSHAGRVVVPLWARSSLEILGDYVQTNEQPVDVLRVRTQTTELSPLFRTALSNFSSALIGDWIAGAEFKRQQRTVFTSGVTTFDGSADVFQLVTGWAGQWSDDFGFNSLDVRVKHNPGNVLPRNTASDWLAVSGGRVTDNRSTIGTVFFGRSTPLFAGTTLSSEYIALISGKALPDTERIALGGPQTVRGYVTEDGAFDQAFVSRSSLYVPAVTFPDKTLNATVAPFVFSDTGTGRDFFTGQTAKLSSVGGGVDSVIGSYFRSNLTLAYALRSGAYTNAGTWRVLARAVVSY
jgi:hemolysin activation/secretion protein